MATFSVTDIGTFKRCRLKWDLSSNARRNLTKVGSGPEALELGGLVHRALADWILESKPEDASLGGIFLLHASKRKDEIIQTFEEQTHQKIQDVHLDSLANIVHLGLDMMNNYQEFHKTPLPKNMKFAMPEQEALVQVPGTEHTCTKCFEQLDMTDPKFLGRTLNQTLKYKHFVDYRKDNPVGCTECNDTGISHHYMSMTLDGLVVDTKDWLWVLEHKTYKNRPQPIDLYMNEQFTKYAWGVSQLQAGKVRGIAYDGMAKKAAPTFTVVNGTRRKQTMEDLFLRKTLEKTPEELEVAGQRITQEINEMANNPEIYPTVPWQGCRQEGCSFLDVCRMKMLGEDGEQLLNANFTQRVVIRGGKTEDG